VSRLIFVGRSDDNSNLVFTTDDGVEYTADIDEHLVRSVTARTVSDVPTVLGVSPRDIQARLRRGEAAQSIAAEAGEPVDRIERYAGPVLAERWHMAQRARGTVVRRPHGDIALEDIALQVLAESGIDTLLLDWDSYRREDGRWNVSVTWPSGSGSGTALWIFDPASLTVVALNDEAKWVFDDQPAPAVAVDRPRLVGLPQVTDPPAGRHIAPDPVPVDQDIDDIEPPSWAGPGHPTVPVDLDEEPSWDDILFGSRPTDH
jgi:hypothetical protein